MKRAAFFSFILAAVLLLSGCQKALPGSVTLRLSDRKVVGVDVEADSSGEGLTETSLQTLADETEGPGAEETTAASETPEASDEPTSEAEREMTSEETTKEPETTEAETTTAIETQAPATAAPTTAVPTTTAAPTTGA